MKKTRRILNLACTFLIVTASPALANDTKLIQFYLNKLGYSVGPVDGIAGRKTRRAIEDFYKEQSLFSQNATPEDVVNALIQVVDQEKTLKGVIMVYVARTNQSITMKNALMRHLIS